MNNYPDIYKVRQQFDSESVFQLEQSVREGVRDAIVNANLSSGSRIAITAGSRGIRNIVPILKEVVNELKKSGLSPFLVAAMGSHGRGEEEGQRDILRSLGITESAMGAPIVCSANVVRVGETAEIDGSIGRLPVYMAKESANADGIIVVNRIKPHTSFRGDYESGLLKMMAVGLGRAKGATMVHSLGAKYMADVIPAIAGVAMENTPVIGGVAIVENAYEETAFIKGVPADKIFEVEKALQKKAKHLMPSLPIKDADVCLIGKMGKNYSGTGMDTNIIGRLRINGIPEPDHPHLKYIGVLGLSESSHGNANGIGLADFTTNAVVNKIDYEATYINCLTSGFVIRAAVPMTFSNDRELLEGILKALKLKNVSEMRLIFIKNTLELEEIWVSEAIYKELKDQANIQYLEGPQQIQFDVNHQLNFSS